MTPGRILLIGGPAGAGKTTTSRALAARRERAIAIPVDEIREWVLSGRHEPGTEDREEMRRQFALAHRVAARTAAEYADAGFDVFLDSSIPPFHVPTDLLPFLGDHRLTGVILTPDAPSAAIRNAERTTKRPEIQAMTAGWIPTSCDRWRGYEFPAGWLVVDTSGQTLDESVAAIEAGILSLGPGG